MSYPYYLKCKGGCNGTYTEQLPMNQINKLTRKLNDVRKCNTCGNIRDVGLCIQEDELYTKFQILGVDPLGKFNSSKGVWIQRV